jgi:hypothetical protein
MHFQKILISTLLISAVSVLLYAQPDKKNKEQARYLSSYEGKTLSPANSPILLPYNRWIDPAGIQIYFGNPEQENHALDVALSPDEKWLAIEGRYELVIVSTLTKEIVANLPLNGFFKNQNIMSTFSVICWIQEGGQYRLLWGAVGDMDTSYVLQANWDNEKLSVSGFIPFGAVTPASTALPNEVLIQKEDGRQYLYVVLNGNNMVVKIDLIAKEKIWTVPVGVAPFGIAKANGKIYITNWAGSLPDSKDPDVAGVPWGSARVDPQNGSTREGTVSVLDPKTGVVLKEIQVGLHPNDIVADNDLALGRIVEAMSKSRFWNSTVIFVTEDDSQSGWDHVSAYRTVGLVISPYSRKGELIHTNYNQPSMVRTIEQILGIPPMNIMDATAKPMFDCFTTHADLIPYQALENLIQLNEMNPQLNALKGDALHFAQKSMEPQFNGIDTGNDDLLNRILWFSMKGKERYPKRFSGKEED